MKLSAIFACLLLTWNATFSSDLTIKQSESLVAETKGTFHGPEGDLFEYYTTDRKVYSFLVAGSDTTWLVEVNPSNFESRWTALEIDPKDIIQVQDVDGDGKTDIVSRDTLYLQQDRFQFTLLTHSDVPEPFRSNYMMSFRFYFCGDTDGNGIVETKVFRTNERSEERIDLVYFEVVGQKLIPKTRTIPRPASGSFSKPFCFFERFGKFDSVYLEFYDDELRFYSGLEHIGTAIEDDGYVTYWTIEDVDQDGDLDLALRDQTRYIINDESLDEITTIKLDESITYSYLGPCIQPENCHELYLSSEGFTRLIFESGEKANLEFLGSLSGLGRAIVPLSEDTMIYASYLGRFQYRMSELTLPFYTTLDSARSSTFSFLGQGSEITYYGAKEIIDHIDVSDIVLISEFTGSRKDIFEEVERNETTLTIKCQEATIPGDYLQLVVPATTLFDTLQFTGYSVFARGLATKQNPDAPLPYDSTTLTALRQNVSLGDERIFDVDGDGYIDVFASTIHFTTVELNRLSTHGLFHPSLDNSNVVRPDFIDYDTDGDFECFVNDLAYTGYGSWFEYINNRPTCSSIVNPFRQFRLQNAIHPTKGDMDNDGVLDVRAGVYAAWISVDSNTGCEPQFVSPSMRARYTDEYSFDRLHDINNNGIPELLVRFNYQLLIYEFHPYRKGKVVTWESGHGTVADIDKDGLNELLHVGKNLNGEYKNLNIDRFDADFTVTRTTRKLQHSFWLYSVADLDGDTLTDFVGRISNNQWHTAHYLSGKDLLLGNEPKEVYWLPAKHEGHTKVGDFDLDGDVDILFLDASAASNESCLKVLLNGGSSYPVSVQSEFSPTLQQSDCNFSFIVADKRLLFEELIVTQPLALQIVDVRGAIHISTHLYSAEPFELPDLPIGLYVLKIGECSKLYLSD